MCRVTTLCVAVPIWGVCRDSYTLVADPSGGQTIPNTTHLGLVMHGVVGHWWDITLINMPDQNPTLFAQITLLYVACQQISSENLHSRLWRNQRNHDLNWTSWNDETGGPRRWPPDADQKHSNTRHLNWLVNGTQTFGVVCSGHLTGRMKRSASVEFTSFSGSLKGNWLSVLLGFLWVLLHLRSLVHWVRLRFNAHILPHPLHPRLYLPAPTHAHEMSTHAVLVVNNLEVMEAFFQERLCVSGHAAGGVCMVNLLV